MGFEQERAAASFIPASKLRRIGPALCLAILGTSCALLGCVGGRLAELLRGEETITTSIADVTSTSSYRTAFRRPRFCRSQAFRAAPTGASSSHPAHIH